MEPIWIAFTGAVIVTSIMTGIGLYIHFCVPTENKKKEG